MTLLIDITFLSPVSKVMKPRISFMEKQFAPSEQCPSEQFNFTCLTFSKNIFAMSL